MKLLALDTATEACSVALNIEGHIIERFALIPRQHSRELLPMIAQLLAEANIRLQALDALAFGCGPGAFTGVRIAAAVTQGLAFAVDRPVIPVSTLAALAQQGLRCYRASQVLAAIDARMDEVYWGAFYAQNGIMRPINDNEIVVVPEHVSVPPSKSDEAVWVGMGTGWCYRARLAAEVTDCYPDTWPHAYDIAQLAAVDWMAGKQVPAEQAVPVYLRDNVALSRHERAALNQ